MNPDGTNRRYLAGSRRLTEQYKALFDRQRSSHPMGATVPLFKPGDKSDQIWIAFPDSPEYGPVAAAGIVPAHRPQLRPGLVAGRQPHRLREPGEWQR